MRHLYACFGRSGAALPLDSCGKLRPVLRRSSVHTSSSSVEYEHVPVLLHQVIQSFNEVNLKVSDPLGRHFVSATRNKGNSFHLSRYMSMVPSALEATQEQY